MKRKFSERVIETVKRIPSGRTMTYREVAAKAGNPKAARAVGNILNAHYRLCEREGRPKIPCHRVVRSDGRSGGYVLGGKRKAALLAAESRASIAVSDPADLLL